MSHLLFAFARMFDFEGRSRRSETIGFMGFVGAVVAFAALWEERAGTGREIAGIAGPVTVIVALLLAIPLAATVVRRLHDTGRRAWMLGVAMVPVLGWMVLARWLLSPGTRGANRFGVDPKGGERGTAPAVVYPFRRA